MLAQSRHMHARTNNFVDGKFWMTSELFGKCLEQESYVEGRYHDDGNSSLLEGTDVF